MPMILKNWQDYNMVEVREKKPGHHALYAKIDIPMMATIGIFGGDVHTMDVSDKVVIPGDTVQVHLDRYNKILFYLKGEAEYEWEGISFMNHNCKPNAWMINPITCVAARIIKKDEEITVNYNHWNQIQEGIPCWCCDPPNLI